MSNGSSGPQGFFSRYFTRLIGAAVGLLAGILFVSIGFWKTLLIIALMTAGWLLGARLDVSWPARMKSVLKKIFRDEE